MNIDPQKKSNQTQLLVRVELTRNVTPGELGCWFDPDSHHCVIRLDRCGVWPKLSDRHQFQIVRLKHIEELFVHHIQCLIWQGHVDPNVGHHIECDWSVSILHRLNHLDCDRVRLRPGRTVSCDKRCDSVGSVWFHGIPTDGRGALEPFDVVTD